MGSISNTKKKSNTAKSHQTQQQKKAHTKGNQNTHKNRFLASNVCGEQNSLSETVMQVESEDRKPDRCAQCQGKQATRDCVQIMTFMHRNQQKSSSLLPISKLPLRHRVQKKRKTHTTKLKHKKLKSARETKISRTLWKQAFHQQQWKSRPWHTILLPTRMADPLYNSTLQAFPASCGFTQSPSPYPLSMV